MFIPRILSNTILKKLHNDNKALIIYGPRQTGKTTMIEKILKNLDLKILTVNGDQEKYIDILSSTDLNKLSSFVSGNNILFIDEAQKIPNIGLNVKILIDNIKNLKIILTGSSSFDLSNKISEPLTGRSWIYNLFPISFLELSAIYNHFELNEILEERLIYGSYPEIFSIKNNNDKKEFLENISNAYLYKDIFELANIKNHSKIKDLLKLLAFQIGSEVSTNELSSSLGIAKDTVENYIDLLEKAFVIFRINAFSRQLRKEIKKMDKIYFYDLGIRNIVIDNLKDLKNRDDGGRLFENFLILERKKLLHYTKTYATQYFWRTYTGAELDYIEERDGLLHTFEFKFNYKKSKIPQNFIDSYPNSSFETINKDNYLKFILSA